MNILVVTQRWYPDTFGGSEHVAAEQARRLALRGHTVTVLTEQVKAVLPPSEASGTLTVQRYGTAEQFERFGGASRTDLEEVPKLINVILNEAKRSEGSPTNVGSAHTREILRSAQNDKQVWDVALLHHPFPAGGFFNAGLAIPSLYLFHSSTAKEVEFDGLRSNRMPSWLRPLLTRLFVMWTSRIEQGALTRATRIAVFSDFSQSILLGMVPHAHRRVMHLLVGIDRMHFHPQDKARARASLGLPLHKKIVLTVRRFTPRMGISRLITAMEQVLRTIPEAQLLIIGEGFLKETLVSEIQRRGLQSKVTLIGTVPLADLPLYYGAADLFVLPSEALEGLGMATLEALACGLPVLGTPAGATPEVLRDLDPLLITGSTSSLHIAEGIRAYFARSEEERMNLGTRARAMVEKKYDWDRAIDELEKILETLKHRNTVTL